LGVSALKCEWSVEIFAFSAGFDDHEITQLNAFVCGKAPAASGAKASAANGYVILGRTAVFYLCVDVTAKWAAHWPFPYQLFMPVVGYVPYLSTVIG
jgi:hypothetical protein